MRDGHRVVCQSYLKTSGGIPSGPALLPRLGNVFTFLNSSRVNGLSPLSKPLYTAGYSTSGVLPSNLCVNHVLMVSSELSPAC